MSVLGFEIALTRAFSVLLRFHFVFLAISLATCGLGIGGLLDFVLRRTILNRTPPAWILVVSGSACGALMPLTFYLLFATRLSALLTSVWLVTAICLPSFLAAGAFMSQAFAWRAAHGGRLYWADLSGAAIGSFGIIAGLQMFGGINAGILCGIIAAAGVCIFAVSSDDRALTVPPILVAAVVAAVFVGNRSSRIINLPLLPLKHAPNAKPLFRELADPKIGAEIMETEWNAFARTDVVSNRGTDDLYIYTDGEVPTNMIRFDGDLQKILPRLKNFIGFYAFNQLRPEKALVIGPGGGLDILLGLAVGTDQIDGAELNPAIPRIMHKYGDMNGHVYSMRGVDVEVAEGRSFVSRSDERYDLIYMALTKTATTTTSTLALVESYAHTTQAYESYIQHLTDNGAVGFVCQSPLILLRTMLTALDALDNLGVPRQTAFDHLCMLQAPNARRAGPYRYMLLISKRQFSDAKSKSLAKNCIAAGWEPVYFPDAFEPQPFKTLTASNMSNRQFVKSWNAWRNADPRINFMPCTDDRPFFVDLTFGIPGQFSRFLWVVAGIAVVLTIAAIRWLQVTSEAGLPPVGNLAGSALYFCCLGAGFMMLEIVLIRRFVLYLGYPVLSLSVILFSLLLGGGMGSLWSQSWRKRRWLPVGAAIACGVVVAGILCIGWRYRLLLEYTLGYNVLVRSLLSIAVAMPVGFFMGIPFPTGIRVIGEWGGDLVPWMWGLNGLMSVVGSVAAMAVAKLYGFSVVSYVGVAIYLLAALLAVLYFISGDSHQLATGAAENTSVDS